MVIWLNHNHIYPWFFISFIIQRTTGLQLSRCFSRHPTARLEAHEARLLGIDLHKGLIDVADELLGAGWAGWALQGRLGRGCVGRFAEMMMCVCV